MASIALPLLVLLPLLAAAAALIVPPAWARRVALAGAGGAFLLVLWACAAYPHVRDLRGWFEAPGGALDQALDEAGVADPLAREALRDLLGSPAPAGVEAARLSALAHLDEARRTLEYARGLTPPEPARLAEAAGALAEAEGEVDRSARALQRVRAAQAETLRLAYGRSGERVRLPWVRPWIPPLGVHWALGVDGLSLPVALVTTLLCLVALLGAPEPRPAAAPGPLRGGVAQAPSRGALVAVLALEALLLLMTCALDVALLHVAWATLLVPAYFLVAARGQASARAALRVLVVGAAGALVALVAAGALASAARPPGAPMTWSVLLLHEAARSGEVAAGLQGWFLVALLAASATRLPLPRAHVDTLAGAPGWAQGVVLWTLLLGATYPLLRLGWALAPEAALGTPGVAAGALGVAALGLGGALVLRAAAPAALLCGSAAAHAGLVLVGLSAARSVAAAGAILDVLVAGLALAALAPVLGGVTARAGAADLSGLAGLARSAPRLAALTGLGLLLAGGVSASTVLVVGGALGSGALPGPLALLVGLGAALLAVAHLRLVARFVADPARGDAARQPDLGDDEALASLPLVVAAVVVGVVMPTLALDLIAPAAEWLTGVTWRAAAGG